MKKIQALRQAAGLSQSQLADKVSSLSLRTLQHYEQGDRDINKAAAGTLAGIAQALGCKVEELLED